MKAEVDTLTAGLLCSRFPSSLAVSPESQMTRIPEGGNTLIDDLIRRSLGEGERELFNRGHTTQGLQRDDSPWFWLARQLYLEAVRDSLLVEQDEDESFWIKSGEDRGLIFRLKPGHSKGAHLFKNLEEKIDQLISRRRDLAGQLVQADDENLVKRLDRRDLLDLISF